MKAKVKLVESPTIWLLKIDSDCFITESEDIPEENQIELTDLNPNTKASSKSTQTVASLQISEKEQTAPLILKVCTFIALVIYHSYRTDTSINLLLGPGLASNSLGFVR